MTGRTVRPVLAAALLTTFLLTALGLTSAILHTSVSWPLKAFGRLLLMGILTILVLRGSAFARWFLVAWYSFSALMIVILLFRIPLLFAGIPILMLAAYVWSVVELARPNALPSPSQSPDGDARATA